MKKILEIATNLTGRGRTLTYIKGTRFSSLFLDNISWTYRYQTLALLDLMSPRNERNTRWLRYELLVS